MHLKQTIQAFILSACTFAASDLVADLTIDKASLSGGEYHYEINQTDMYEIVPEEAKMAHWEWEPTGNQLLDDAYSFFNVQIQSQPRWSFLQLKPGARKGGLIYRFDFSQTGQVPLSFNVNQRVRFEADGTNWKKPARTGFASYYRQGESGPWIEIEAIQDVSGYKADQYLQTGPIALDRSKGSVVYFKVLLTSDQPIRGSFLKKGQTGFVEGRGGPLWNFVRTDTTDQFFSIDFELSR
jgi:hypothetical protein